MPTTRRAFLTSLAGLAALPSLSRWGVLAAAPPVRMEYPVGVTFNQRYHPTGMRHSLDVFTPKGREKAPVVMFVHGGTWMFGDKNFFGLYRGVGRFLARSGFTTMVPNYRLSPFVKHPEHARDVARAYAWTWRNAERFGGDPSRIILMGHSAGGHLVSLLATDRTYLEADELKLDDTARKAIKGVVGVCGVYRVPAPDEFKEMAKTIANAYVGESRFNPALVTAGQFANPFPYIFGKDRNVQEAASPLTHVRKGLPPFLLMNAVSEVPGLFAQRDGFEAALRKEGNQVESQTIEGCCHRNILFSLDKVGDESARVLLEFLDKRTGGKA